MSIFIGTYFLKNGQKCQTFCSFAVYLRKYLLSANPFLNKSTKNDFDFGCSFNFTIALDGFVGGVTAAMGTFSRSGICPGPENKSMSENHVDVINKINRVVRVNLTIVPVRNAKLIEMKVF